jgi:hypothetical protein
MNMSKFLDLIKAHLPEKEKTVVAKRTIPPRERPRPSKGANAPMEISKGSGANPVDEQVNSFVELLFSKGIAAKKSSPDTVKIKTGDGTVLVKILPEEDGETDAYGTAMQIVDRSADRPDDPANPVSKQTRMKANTETVKANKYVNDRISEMDKQMSTTGNAKVI